MQDYVANRTKVADLRSKLKKRAETYNEIGKGILSDPELFFFWNLDEVTPEDSSNDKAIVIQELDFEPVGSVNIMLIEYRKACRALRLSYGSLLASEKEALLPPDKLFGSL